LEDEIMVLKLSGTQPQGPKHLETLENKTVDGTQNTVRVNRGTSANRPLFPIIGELYFDTTLNKLIQYFSTGWDKVSPDPAPEIISISPTTASTIGTTINITGLNFRSGATVQFIGTNSTSYNSPVVTFVSQTSITATTPALSVSFEPYDIKVINDDNKFSILENALDAGGTPVWNTPSGNIATIAELTSLNASVSATDPDGTSIVYSSINLPTATPTPVTYQVTNSGSGAYLIDGVSNGSITLTRGGTYTFNVNASGHPFYIQTTGNGYNSNNVYSTGVTGAGTQVGTVTFVVPNNAPDTLFYQCQYHSSMYGQINIISASPWISLNSSTGALTGTAPEIESDTNYTFDITASDGVNSSSRSFSILSTNILLGDYESIASTTLTSSQAAISFNSIPQDYKHLQIRWVGATVGGDYMYIKSNISPTKVSRMALLGTTIYNAANYDSDATYGTEMWFGGIDVSEPASGIIDILDYSNTTKVKQAKILLVRPHSTGPYNSLITLINQFGSSTSAINSITFQSKPSYPLCAGTTVSLYGIKG
jgi:hypothetical protein